MTTLAVTDTETTGVSETDQVCELAIVWIDESLRKPPRGGWRWSSLIRPSCPVSPEGRAAHHITDAQLAQAWPMEEMLRVRGLPEYLGPRKDGDVVFVAHNAEFDRRMLTQSFVSPSLLPARTICTWRCALHLFPDAPRHSNQVLRYYLDLGVPEPVVRSLPPHRALPDAIVTAALVCRMLKTHTADQLVELTQMPVLLGTVRFGKHRGMEWREVDSGYLRWILGQDFGPDEIHTASHWLRERNER